MEYVDFLNTKDDSVWTIKYCPKIIDDIIGNSSVIDTIGNWLLDFEKNKKLVLSSDGIKKRKRKTKAKIKFCDDDQSDITDENNEDNINDDNDIIKEKLDYDMDGLDDLEGLDDTTDMDCTDMDETNELAEKYGNGAKVKMQVNQGPFPCIIIIGNHGVGKTCITNAILKSMGYTKQTINFSKIKKASDIFDAIDGIVRNTNILSIMEGKVNNKVAVVIDETESILCPRDKACILTLIKHNIMSWICPMIFISDGQHSKLLTEIKKNSQEVKILPPFKTEMITLIKKIIKNEKMSIQGINSLNNSVPNGEDAVNAIIEHSQKDYRRLIMTLHDLKYAYNNKTITQTMFNEYLKLSKKKDEDYNLFKATNCLLQNYNGIDETIRFFETDKSILPLMMQQNYIECINSKTSDNDLKFKLASRISGMLSEGDVVENYIFGEQNWDIADVHGFYTCVAPSYLLSNNLGKDKYLQLLYPQDLNKASISKINRKNILKISGCGAFYNKNIIDYVYINQIIRFMTAENRMEECINMLKDYNITLKNIESLLKIDKIKSTKQNLTGKQKKEISSFLSN